MDHAVKPFGLEQVGHALAVADVQFDEAEVRMRLKALQAVKLEVDVVVVVQIVQPHDLVATRQEAQRGGHADETCSTCQQYLHDSILG